MPKQTRCIKFVIQVDEKIRQEECFKVLLFVNDQLEDYFIVKLLVGALNSPASIPILVISSVYAIYTYVKMLNGIRILGTSIAKILINYAKLSTPVEVLTDLFNNGGYY